MTGKRSVNKAACKRLAAELRAEIDLGLMDAFDPWKLAELYGVRVISISSLPLTSEIREHFTVARPDVFSGALVPIGSGTVIIENDAHPDTRRRSTMAHELAHVVGEHKFGTSLVNERGCRLVDQVQEEEAAEIGGELLIPFEAAKKLALRSATNEEVARQFGVSIEFARWRMDATGARLIAARKAAVHSGARRA